MKLFDKLLQKKIAKELQKMGINEDQIDPSRLGISSENLLKIGGKLKEILARDPNLKDLDLSNISELMQHKDALRKVFEEHKDELQELMGKARQEQ